MYDVYVDILAILTLSFGDFI